MRNLYFRVSKIFAQLYRWVIIYVKCILLAGVLTLAIYLSMADPQTETFGNFLKFLQVDLLKLSVVVAILLFLPSAVYDVMQRRYAVLRHEAGQEADSCGGK